MMSELAASRDPARTEDGGDVEEQDVQKLAPCELGLNFCAGGGGQSDESSVKQGRYQKWVVSSKNAGAPEK